MAVLYMQRSAWLLAAVMGAWRAGCGISVVDTSLPTERLSFVIEDTKSCIIITDTVSYEEVTAVDHRPLPPVLVVGDDVQPAAVAVQPEPQHLPHMDKNSVCAIIYTSGSTGR